MPPVYRFLLTDLMSRKVLSDAIAFNLSSYARALNGSGDCSGTLDLSDPEVYRHTDPIGSTEPRRTALWVIRDGALVWGGIIWTRRYRSADHNLDLTVSSPESYFNRRRIRETLTYTNRDQHDILHSLVNHAQAQPYGNIGVVVPGWQASGRPGRDRTYAWHERATYLERMQQLSEVIDGPDWTMTPDWTGPGQPGWYLNTGSPLGSTRDLDLEFPGDFRNYSWPDDGGNSANFWTAIGDPVGEEETPQMRDAQVSAEWAVGYPLLEDISNHQGVSVADTLSGYAQANVKAAAGNRVVPEGTLRLLDFAELPAPGDEYRLRITDPYRWPANPVTGAAGLIVPNVRVTGWTVNVSADEGETVSLNITGVA